MGSIPNEGDESTGPWLYNDQARIITHAAHSCDICSKWAHHYVSSVVIDDATLRKASEKRNTVICASLTVESASLQRTNDSLRRELDAVRVEVARLRGDLHSANNKISRLRDELRDSDVRYRPDSKNRVKGDDLTDQTHELERGGDTPRRRKLPRLGSRTSSSTPLLLPFMEPSLPTPAEHSPLAANGLAIRIDNAVPGSVKAAPPPPQQPASPSLTRRSYVSRQQQQLTASQTRRA